MARNMEISGPTLGTPAWAGEVLGPKELIPGGAKLDAAQFLATDAVVVTVGAAGAAAGAVSIPVDALEGPIPSGTVLNFGTNKFARLTAAAADGAVTLTVAAIPTALVDNDTATYAGVGRRTVPSGTVIGRTIAERDAGTGFGPADAADDEIHIVPFDVYDVSQNDDVELTRHHIVVKENFLPGWDDLDSGVQDLVRELYHCVRGVA